MSHDSSKKLKEFLSGNADGALAKQHKSHTGMERDETWKYSMINLPENLQRVA